MPPRGAGPRDPYAVLGLRRGASAEEVRAAYRRAAIRWHPDKNPADKDAERRFKEISEAYDTLTSGRVAAHGVPWPGAAPGEIEAAAADALGAVKGVFGAVLDAVFGAQEDPLRGADVRAELAIDPQEARMGAIKSVPVTSRQRCANCGGSGRQPGRAPACARCGGRGVTTVDLGLLTLSASCPDCGGGRNGPRCLGCAGAGLTDCPGQHEVQVPPRIRNGTTLRYAGQGEPARSTEGRPGDLLVTFRVRCP